MARKTAALTDSQWRSITAIRDNALGLSGASTWQRFAEFGRQYENVALIELLDGTIRGFLFFELEPVSFEDRKLVFIKAESLMIDPAHRDRLSSWPIARHIFRRVMTRYPLRTAFIVGPLSFVGFLRVRSWASNCQALGEPKADPWIQKLGNAMASRNGRPDWDPATRRYRPPELTQTCTGPRYEALFQEYQAAGAGRPWIMLFTARSLAHSSLRRYKDLFAASRYLFA